MTNAEYHATKNEQIADLIRLGLTDEQVERVMALFRGKPATSQDSIGRLRSELSRSNEDVLPEHVVNGGWRDHGEAFSREKRVYAEPMLEAGLTDEMIVGALRREFYDKVPEPRHVADLRSRLISSGRRIPSNSEARQRFKDLYSRDLGEPKLIKGERYHREAAKLIETEAPLLVGEEALAWLMKRGFGSLCYRRLNEQRLGIRAARKTG